MVLISTGDIRTRIKSAEAVTMSSAMYGNCVLEWSWNQVGPIMVGWVRVLSSLFFSDKTRKDEVWRDKMDALLPLAATMAYINKMLIRAVVKWWF